MDRNMMKTLLAVLLLVAALIGQSSQSTLDSEQLKSCVVHFSKDLKQEAPDVAAKIETYLRDANPTMKDLPIEQLIEQAKPTRICEGMESGEINV